MLDIKIRSNSIQLRTCVDSAFTLIELINYIVSDGDLHQPNLIISEFMSQQSVQTPTLTTIPLNQGIEMQQQSEQIESVPVDSLKPSNTNLTKAINIASSAVSSSIPIQRKSSAVFTVGSPPSSFKSSSSFTQQAFYSPLKTISSSSNMSPSVLDSNLNQRTQPMTVPLPSPSLSFVNFKTVNPTNTMCSVSFNASSSAESLISDMVKEAMTSNPMTQSIYGSLNSPATVYDKKDSRKRNPSLTMLSPDMQTKRLISQSFMTHTNPGLNTLKESSNLSSLRNSDDDDDDIKSKINYMKELQKNTNEEKETKGCCARINIY